MQTATATLADGAAVEQNFGGCDVTVMGGDQIRHIYNFMGTVNILNTSQDSGLNALNIGCPDEVGEPFTHRRTSRSDNYHHRHQEPQKLGWVGKRKRMKELEELLKSPFEKIGFQNARAMLTELQDLKGAVNTDILLKVTECEMHLQSEKAHSSTNNLQDYICNAESKSSSTVLKMAAAMYNDKCYARAVIFFKISHELRKHEKRKDQGKEPKWIGDRVADIYRANEAMVDVGGSYRKIVVNYGVKYMEDLLDDLRRTIPCESRALEEASCLVNLCAIRLRISEYKKSIEHAKEGIDLLVRYFKESAATYKRYAWLHYDLGLAYHATGQRSKAKEVYQTAIAAAKTSVNYEQIDRKRFVEITEKMIKKLS